jgi:tRNA-dihydrouridine synthase A
MMPTSNHHPSIENLKTNQVLSVAPMMDWTDRHCRYFMRLLNPFACLYTEMVSTKALMHTDQGDHLLAYDESEHPVVLQVGGACPQELVHAAKLAKQYHYDQININVGCPSDRVQQAKFGACLMAEPQTVADCVAAMREAVDIPVTVKTRLGIDFQDDYEFVFKFIETVSKAGCDYFIMHARKAYLQGLDPKENRTIPPLNYERVLQLQKDFPHLRFDLNGGIDSVSKTLDCLKQFRGVMLGRMVYHEPYVLAQLAQALAGEALPDRAKILEDYYTYVEKEFSRGTRLTVLVKPIFGLYHGEVGGRLFRRFLSENLSKKSASPQILLEAIERIR